jgi:ADP-ribose pyrophosphatase YjhB (NUDIX family)
MKTFKQFFESTIHPEKDEYGSDVIINKPHVDSPIHHWNDNNKHATITPNSNNIPEHINNIPFSKWEDRPKTTEDWNKIDGQGDFEEPPLENPHNKKISTGAIIHEKDGRVWVFHPTNQFANIEASFPKGKLDKNINLRANAIKEVGEETGLKIKLTGHAADSDRTTGKTRYYHAERVGGHPANMGWESQAVSLVPKSNLKDVLNSPLDHKVVDKLS